MSDAKKSYSTSEREGLVIVIAVKKFCHYLFFEKFRLFTDHEALKYVLNTRENHVRMTKWMNTFAEYIFEFYYQHKH